MRVGVDAGCMIDDGMAVCRDASIATLVLDGTSTSLVRFHNRSILTPTVLRTQLPLHASPSLSRDGVPSSLPSSPLLPPLFISFFRAPIRMLAEQLCDVDPSVLSDDEKLAFFLNLYNALLLHVSEEAMGMPPTAVSLPPLQDDVAASAFGV